MATLASSSHYCGIMNRWDCGSCTYSNNDNSPNCYVCQAPKPNAQLPSNTEIKIPCEFCDQMIASSSYTAHLRQVHKPEQATIPCDKCAKQIQIAQYNEHIASHKIQIKAIDIICDICHKSYTVAEIDSHKLAHEFQTSEQMKDNLIPCEYKSCGMKLEPNDYESHIAAHKAHEQANKYAYDEIVYIPCDLCKYKIPSAEYEQHHAKCANVSTNNDDILILCDWPQCNEKVAFNQLKLHQENHTKKQEQKTENMCIACEYKGCSKLIPMKQLQSHQETHRLEDANTNLHQQLAVLLQTKDDLENKTNDVELDWLQKKENEAMETGETFLCKLELKRHLVNDSADVHFRLCESQFMRSCGNMGAATNGRNKTIKEVEYIFNPTLKHKFAAKKSEIMIKNNCKESELNVVLAWHGTKAANVDNIVQHNFSLAQLGAHTGNRGAYGAGIYFSEFANVSQAYGDALILCKVLLGKEYQMNAADGALGRALEVGYDSHVVVNGNNNQYGQEVVIYDADQILPCYIVRY